MNNKINHPIDPRFIVNNIKNSNSYVSTNESNDFEDVNMRFLTPKVINNFDRNWVYKQQKLNFNNPSTYNNNNNVNNSQTYEEL